MNTTKFVVPILLAATALGQNEPQSSQFKRVAGTALSTMVPCVGPGSLCFPQSIAAGPNGTAWVLGTAKTSGGDYYVYQWKNSKWVRASVGAGTQIAVGIDGYPWVLTHTGAIYYWNGTTFVLAPSGGCATSIGVGPGYGSSQFPYGVPWIIGCNGSSTTDGTIYEYTGDGWSVWPGGANRIAVSPQGEPVVITTYGSVWYQNINGAFVETPAACANSVAAGSDSDPLSAPFADVWVTFCGDVNSQGAKIFQLQNGTAWVRIPGVASQISVAPDTGVAWVVTLTGEIFKN
ncbi:MAG: hypothetical protein ACLP59_02860 [Bryobacteraceae bacterium]